MQIGIDPIIKKNVSPTKKIAVSGLVMALYIVLMYFTQGFAFGQYQIRMATSLYALSAVYPFLIVPLGLSNLLSNTLMGGLGMLDMVGGLIVGIITASAVYLIKRLKISNWFIALPIILCPGLIVPIWLSIILNVPYKILAASILIGQIFPGIIGAVIVNQLEKRI